MRVISMVPSWTETLIRAGVNVVGRTRFCIHPEELVRDIPIVGGTKDIFWEKVKLLSPDLLLLDREENPKFMADESPYRYLATHIRSVEDVAIELVRIAEELSDDSKALRELAARWQAVLLARKGTDKVGENYGENHGKNAANLTAKFASKSSGKNSIESARKNSVENSIENVVENSIENSVESFTAETKTGVAFSENIPGIVKWINPLRGSEAQHLYLIWKKPWMVASTQTFIGSMLKQVSIGGGIDFDRSYPVIDLNDFDKKKTLLLFSTEPFPFEKVVPEIMKMGFASALVDGELFSWFGIRSLEFLEAQSLLLNKLT